MTHGLSDDVTYDGYAGDPEGAAYRILSDKNASAEDIAKAQALGTLALIREIKVLRRDIGKLGNKVSSRKER